MSSRLLQLQTENDQVGAEMLIESARFDQIRGTNPRAVSAFNLFQTPERIAERMVSLLPDTDGYPVILEPSAGLGRLYTAAWNRYNDRAFYHLVDTSEECCGELKGLTESEHTSIHNTDFLSIPVRLFKYDFILMNPPFKNGRDVKHVKHALRFLKPGGLLVALCYNGVRQNSHLRPIADTWEVLPAGSFKESGTGADVVLLTVKGRGITE